MEVEIDTGKNRQSAGSETLRRETGSGIYIEKVLTETERKMTQRQRQRHREMGGETKGKS